MRLFVHKNRNLVVAPELGEDEDASGDVSVLYVGLSPTVEGVARRGRPPAKKDEIKAVPASELVALDASLATDDLKAKAVSRLMECVPAAETVDDSDGSDDAAADESSED